VYKYIIHDINDDTTTAIAIASVLFPELIFFDYNVVSFRLAICCPSIACACNVTMHAHRSF